MSKDDISEKRRQEILEARKEAQEIIDLYHKTPVDQYLSVKLGYTKLSEDHIERLQEERRQKRKSEMTFGGRTFSDAPIALSGVDPSSLEELKTWVTVSG